MFTMFCSSYAAGIPLFSGSHYTKRFTEPSFLHVSLFPLSKLFFFCYSGSILEGMIYCVLKKCGQKITSYKKRRSASFVCYFFVVLFFALCSALTPLFTLKGSSTKKIRISSRVYFLNAHSLPFPKIFKLS